MAEWIEAVPIDALPDGGGKLFTYFNNAGTDLGDAPSLAAVKRVRIAFTVQLKNPDPKIGGTLASELSTSVELRN